MPRPVRLWLFLLPLALPLYLVRFQIGPFPTTLLEVFVILSFVFWLIFRKNLRSPTATTSFDKETINNPLVKGEKGGLWFWPIIVWLAVTLFSVLIASDKWAALGHWRAFMLEPVLVFVMLADILSSAEDQGQQIKDFLFFGMATVCILLGAYAVIQFFTGWGIPHPWDALPGRRATGVFGYPNGLALFMAPFAVVCFIAWLNAIFEGKDWLPRWLFLAAWILSFAAEIVAKSLGGLAALTIGLTLALIVHHKTRKIGVVVALLGMIAAGIVAAGILGTRLKSTDLDESLYLTKRWSSMVRTVIWQESWQLIKAHPLLGTGLRSYQTAVAPYHTATWMEIYPHPHNIILMLWIETGLAGLLAFIWLCMTWVRAVHSAQCTVLSHGKIDNILHPASQSSCVGRSTLDVRRCIWLVPLIVILAHGLVDMPYFKNDLAMQFWILAALASF